MQAGGSMLHQGSFLNTAQGSSFKSLIRPIRSQLPSGRRFLAAAPAVVILLLLQLGARTSPSLS